MTKAPKIMILRFLLILLVSVGLVSSATITHAARSSPMVVDVEPVGRASTARVEISNPSDGDFPVEILMFRGEISEIGELSLVPADEEFLVFPAQTRVAPQSQQVVRVQYAGEPEVARSQIYYMGVRQIPVAFSPGESALQLLVNFNVLVNVVPDGTVAEPVVDYVRPGTKEGVAGLDIRVRNDGTRYYSAGLNDWRIRGIAEDGSAVALALTGAEMSGKLGIGVVPPGGARVFFVPLEQKLKAEGLEVTLTLPREF